MIRWGWTAAIVAVVLCLALARSARADSVSVSDLPLKEIAAADTSGERMAVLISGDGGWSNFDEGVSEGLAKRGIPVVGVNALGYFWKRRSPEETAKDLERIVERYGAAWHKQRVLVMGYSFGADVLPFAVSRLAEGVRQRIALVAMLAPSHHADFEFHVTYWMHVEGKTRWLVKPEVEKLAGMKVLAICEEGDEDALCSDLPAEAATMVVLKGGHHFNRDYETIVQTMMDAMK
jgi:type IV secretory pathway VirJ component